MSFESRTAYSFRFGNGALKGTCAASQWTSFQTDANDVTTVRDLIANGNPTAWGIGDSIWIEPGVKATIYDSVLNPADVLIPVVQRVTSANGTIVGFAAFHIDSVNKTGKNKYIQGHLIAGYKITATTGQSGPYYGAYVPPRLAQ